MNKRWVAAFSVWLAVMAGGVAGAEAIVVKRVPRDAAAGVSMLRNGDLERVVRGAGDGAFADTEAWSLGYAVDDLVARGGRYSARCASEDADEQRGIAFVVELNQTRATPIRAQCWSRAHDVTGSSDGGYSLYLDILYTDGTPLWGQVSAFPTGTHDWEKRVVTVVPAKPIREVRVHGLFRGHRGTAWFDDFALWEPRPRGKWNVFDGVLVEEGAASAGRRARHTVEVGGADISLTLDAATGRILGGGRAGGLLVRDVAADSDFRQPLGRVTRTANGARFSGDDPELGLALEAEYESGPGHVRVRGKVRDLTGRDRAVTVCLTVPLDASGWRWARGLRDDERIAADQDYQESVGVAGGTGRMARWPFAAVYPGNVGRGDDGSTRRREAGAPGHAGSPSPGPPSAGASASGGHGDARPAEEAGVAIGYPLDLPRINRVGYNAGSRELYAAVDLGLSGETRRFPHEASFDFVLYAFAPEWGMRAALKRYYEIFAECFVKRVEREGMWMPFTDIASVEGWEDFGFAFKEGTNNVPFDSAHGIYSFVYVEPVSYWMAMPQDVPRTREAAQALLEEKARAAPETSYAAATRTSIIQGADGQPVVHVLKAPWCDGALFILNPAPGVPLTEEHRTNKAQVMFADIERAMSGERWPLAEWRAWDRGYVVEPGGGPDGATALRCENAPGESSGASQTVILSPPRQEPMVARTWSKADRVTGEADVDYSLYLDLLYADGTPGYAFVAPFATGTHDWEVGEVRIDPPKPVAQVQFHMLLRAPHAGRAWFARPELRVGDGGGNLLANTAFEASTGPRPAVSGTYIDSMEMGCEYLNFRREHWRDVEIPLVFEPATGRCGQALIFGTYEFIAECARRMRERGKLMFANGALWRYAQFAALLDVMGTETNWLRDGELHPQSDDVMMLRRGLCYQKPYCLLMNSEYDKFPREYTERYFRHCLFYGIFPGFFSHNAADDPYWARPTLYNRDRELFKRYMPLIREIARAGWEPVTHARSDDPEVYVERYGPRQGVVYLTVMNASDGAKQTRIAVDAEALDMTGASATELLNDRPVRLRPDGTAGVAFVADLQPQEVWLVKMESEAPR